MKNKNLYLTLLCLVLGILIGKFMLEHLRDAVTNIELLPEKWKTESLFQYLGKHMTQKYRPKWCSPNVWKYRAT